MSCQNLVVARRILAKAQRGTTDGGDLAQGVLDGVEGWIVERAHGREGYNARCLGSAEDFQRLRFGGAEGLLDDDVLATGDADKGLLVVKCVRAADIDGVDVGSCRELIE